MVCFNWNCNLQHHITLLFSPQSLSFECTNLAGLEQVNALATINTPLQSLTISPWGNPITQHSLFPSYTLYRLHHLGLAELNGATLSNKDRATAERLFGRLGELTTSSLPQTRLLAFVSKYRLLALPSVAWVRP